MDISIRIENFKNLEDVTFDLKQTMFLFGPNGSGKSSLIKALLFLNRNILPIRLLEKTNYKIDDETDLVNFYEIVNKNDITKKVSFTIFIKTHTNYVDFKPSISVEEWEDNGVEHRMEHTENYYARSEFEYNPYQKHDFCVKVSFSEQTDGYNFDELIISNRINHTSFSLHRESDSEKTNIKQKIDEHYAQSLSNRLEAQLDIVRKHSHIQKVSVFTNDIIDDLYNCRVDLTLDVDDNERKHIPFIPSVALGNTIFEPQISYYELKQSWEDHFFKVASVIFNEATKNDERSLSEIESEIIVINLGRQLDLFFRLIPTIINQNLTAIHYGTIREIPKTKYYIDQSNIEKEYYSIPLMLNYAQNSLRKILAENGFTEGIEPSEIINKLEELKKVKEISTKEHSSIAPSLEIIKISPNPYNFILQLNNFLKSFGLAESVYLKKDKYIYSIMLVGEKNEKFNIASASSGFIQIFPILARLALDRVSYPRGSNEKIDYNHPPQNEPEFEIDSKINLMIQQPELHLHPKLQTKLVEQFTKAKSKRIIVETHSEHMVRKLQTLIAKGEVERENVVVYYFDKGHIKEMKFKLNGLFESDWPDGFFDDAADLTFELFEEIAKRQN